MMMMLMMMIMMMMMMMLMVMIMMMMNIMMMMTRCSPSGEKAVDSISSPASWLQILIEHHNDADDDHYVYDDHH